MEQVAAIRALTGLADIQHAAAVQPPPLQAARRHTLPDPGGRLMDDLDRRIINNLQGGFPVSERPFLDAARTLGIGERDLIDRIENLLETGVLSRFGPMYHAERLGGGLTLAALAAPPERFDEVAALVNAHPEVAHNYERDHELNMWFVLATERPERHRAACSPKYLPKPALVVHDMRKLEEFFVGLRFEA